MSRDDDAMRGEVETAIPLMRGGISEKDTCCRARCQLVTGGGGHIWVAKAPVAKMASHAIFQYNVLVIDIDNRTLGLI